MKLNELPEISERDKTDGPSFIETMNPSLHIMCKNAVNFI